MDLGNGLGHLTYSTLVHPGDTWSEMWDSLNRYVPTVKARVCPDKPFGVSLRLSASSAQTLTGDPHERQRLKEFLHSHDMYLYTVNAFPYGPFKNQLVKEQVYEPDWRSDERALYTMQVADILVFWDNRCTQHHAVWDYYPHTRYGERVSIVGTERPAA